MLPLYVVELGGPLLAERRLGGTPWHAHHVAERHGLLAIIALGECLLGTIAALSVLVDEHEGLTVDVVVLGLAGTGLAFSMWWLYFTLPSGEVLHRRRALGFRWGYGHIAVFMAIAATGAGLHVAAYYLEGESKLGAVGVVLATAVPVAVFGLCLGVLYAMLVGLEPAAWRNGLSALAILAVAVGLAAAGSGCRGACSW